MKIVCTDISSVSAGDIDTTVFEKYGEVVFYDVTPPELTSERIKDADMILVLDHGRISEMGTHEELIKKPGLYKTIYEIQSKMA